MIIRREAWKAALAVTIKADSAGRYLLNTVHITPAGVVEATDGLVAVRVTDTAPFPDVEFPSRGADAQPLTTAVSFDAEFVKRLIGAMPKRATIPILAAAQVSGATEHGPATALATDLDVPVTIKAVDGSFPDLDRVFVGVAERPHVKVIFSTDVLRKLIGVIEASAPDQKAPTLTLEIPTETRYQGQQPDTSNTDDDVVMQPNGIVEAGIRVTGRSSRSSVAVEALAMPHRR